MGVYEDAYGENAAIFRRGMPNPKIPGRTRLLEEHPELRLRVNLAPLRDIIDFVMFKCVRGSSIARDQAIHGSDIDGGLVVLREPTERDVEMAFIDELRTQGFDVYHPSEAEAANAAREEAVASGMISDNWAAFKDISMVSTVRGLNRIEFIPEDVLQAADPYTTPGRTYVGGYTIPNYPA
jgi:hypothetical protein